MQQKSKSRKAKVTYTDIVLAYLVGGMDNVPGLLEDHTSPVNTLDRALAEIDARDPSRDISDLRAFRDTLADARSGTRGAKPLAAAGSKVYSVQRVGEGDTFIILPVSVLGANKGAGVRVYADGSGSSARLIVTLAEETLH